MDAENTVPTEQPTEPTVETKVAPATFDATTGDEVVQSQEEQNVDAQADDKQVDRDEKGRFKGVQARIDELTRKRGEAERETAYWRAQAMQAQPSAQAAPEKPTPDKFDDYGDYVEALTDWKTEQAVAKRFEQDSTRKVVETRAQTFQERQSEYRRTVPDYDSVVSTSTAPISSHVGEVLLDSKHGPALSYHFAKNPDVLMQLNHMSPLQAASEIGRLESTLPSTPVPPAKKFSNAPVPAGTLGTQGRTTTPPLATASMDEYMAQRKAQGARWAR